MKIGRSPAPEVAWIAKYKNLIIVAAAVVIIVIAGWYFLRSKPKPPKVVPQEAPPPVTTPAEPSKSETQPVEEAASNQIQPRRARVAKPKRSHASRALRNDHKGSEVENLQELARAAYAKSNYAEPAGDNAIAYSKRVLAIDAKDAYAQKLLENSVEGGRYQVQQAITRKDFVTAHRVANALAQLAPGRPDVKGLSEDIAAAEHVDEPARRPASGPAPLISFRVYHLHTEKAPIDNGPYCVGILTVVGGHLKFSPKSATDSMLHTLDFPCSEVREIKKNSHVASHQGGFHVRASSTNINFVPADQSASVVSALDATCLK